MFAAQQQASLDYLKLEAPLDGFVATVETFFQGGGSGINVTVPFKAEAAAWVGRLEPLAAFADAVNTIVPEADGFGGFNTDGPGLVRDLGRWLDGRPPGRVLLLGAGGAGRGVALPLLEGPASELVIANRTESRAVTLAARLAERVGRSRVRSCGWSDLPAEGPFDLVINATSAGLNDQAPAVASSVLRGAVCYDMVYGADTAFCRAAREAGASRAVDGLGMLVEQAALAFELWRGVLPRTDPVLDTLRLAVGKPNA